MESQEKIFLQDNNVMVTQSRFISGGKTYAMSNISSVNAYKIEKSRAWPVGLIIIGIIIIIGEAYTIGIIMAVLGVLWFMGIKDEYSVRIQSNSGEADGLLSQDRGYVQKVVDSINEAIVYRG